jgi:ribosomal protein L11 methyltransferase
VELHAAQAAKAEALLKLAGASAISLDDAEDSPVLEPPPGAAPLWPVLVMRALFPIGAHLAPLAAVLKEACGAREITIEALDDTRWQAALRRVTPARQIGRLRLASAADDSGIDATSPRVRLHMGLAFGTGEHATTSLCLEWLEARLVEGARVLDYGCGSGILALASLALGASYAWAVDIDEQALQATRDNAALNTVTDRIWIGAPHELPAVAADVVVANILAGTLESLASVLCGYAARTLVLSGILSEQRELVQRAYAPFCESFAASERDGWVCIEAHRRRER